MSNYQERWNEAAEEARKRQFPNSTLVLCGRNPAPPRGHADLFTPATAWFAKYNSHDLGDETMEGRKRKRTLDFFIGDRSELTDELVNKISSVMFDGKRYNITTEPRRAVDGTRYLQIICHPTGETV